ncbi:MAG TPA: glycoside hydrolase family 2 TIM barrel-domain containing protein [Trebonia sp.]|nr:glycoside hydrolase family 2 TIM barrel-domain containing protein [Trebonia sp.]
MEALEWNYPRPDFDRSARWLDLSGAWEFARHAADTADTADTAAAADDGPAGPQSYRESIVVPFPWESPASGVAAAWLERAWYRRTVEVPSSWAGERVIIKFGGVHHRARVFVNGTLVGEHAGVGPFECDVTDALAKEPDGGLRGTLVVGVEAPNDKQHIAHGKQRSIPAADYDSCSFQPSSGIWQPVWLEPRPATFLRQVEIVPAQRLDGFEVAVRVAGPSAAGARLTLTVTGTGTSATAAAAPDGTARFTLPVEAPRLWSPQDPHLYRILARAETAEGIDEVTCTAGLRRIEVTGEEIRLNGRRLFLRGVLDQGYWPQTGLTAPTPEALRKDLALARAAGYNLVRKHLKLEDPRWLHFADQEGMLVWAEPPSTSRFSPESVAAFRQGLASLVERDVNHPCIVIWGCFNEEWGLDWQVSHDPARQEAVAQAVDLVRALDRSRPVVDNSGWTHVGGDLVDWHYYEADLERWAKNVDALVAHEAAEIPVALHPDTVTMKPLLARTGARHATGRPNLNSEYGMGFTSVERGWYLKWQTQELRRQNRLAGYVYTELYDIEHEMAGLLAVDRSRKDLGNIDPADVNAETVLVLDVVPVRPGTDLELAGQEATFTVRCSHHGDAPVRGRLRWDWQPHLAPTPAPAVHSDTTETGGAALSAAPFVLSEPARVTVGLPPGWMAGRLRLWLQDETAVLATTSLDVVRRPA